MKVNDLLTAKERAEENICNKTYTNCFLVMSTLLLMHKLSKRSVTFMNESKRLYHFAVLVREAMVAALNCALLWFPQ